ncbi:hypothetical protein ABZ464_20900 [Streptomyces sp. NPDC005820]|uniref:hypothetical protein n=1 Tax=Streptomyces sp. NPDC005820 TaxID=3157069 RepID=UPI00340407A6
MSSPAVPQSLAEGRPRPTGDLHATPYDAPPGRDPAAITSTLDLLRLIHHRAARRARRHTEER